MLLEWYWVLAGPALAWIPCPPPRSLLNQAFHFLSCSVLDCSFPRAAPVSVWLGLDQHSSTSTEGSCQPRSLPGWIPAWCPLRCPLLSESSWNTLLEFVLPAPPLPCFQPASCYFIFHQSRTCCHLTQFVFFFLLVCLSLLERNLLHGRDFCLASHCSTHQGPAQKHISSSTLVAF